MSDVEKPERGLSSIRDARALRAERSFTPQGASGKFWLWSAVAVVAITIFYWKKSDTDNEAHRTRVLAKQRGVAAEMAPLYFPLREKIEGWTMALAQTEPGEDVIAPSFSTPGAADALLQKPGIYLRLAQPNATSVPKLRAAAMDSLRDAFTACFLRAKNPDPREGKDCKSTKECEKGKVCNEAGHCTVLSQPANLRVAYRGMRVLEDTWIREVQTATDALRLRLFDSDLDSAVAADIPAAIDLMVKGQYFLVVLDEVPVGVKAPEGSTLEETVQALVHPTRVGLYDVKTGELLFRGRREIDVTVPVVPGSVDVQRRQILNCELARDVRRTLRASE